MSNMMDYAMIGKDGQIHAVPIMTMATLGDAVWKKSAWFDHLAAILSNQKGHHSIQEFLVTAMMSSVFLIGTETA